MPGGPSSQTLTLFQNPLPGFSNFPEIHTFGKRSEAYKIFPKISRKNHLGNLLNIQLNQASPRSNWLKYVGQIQEIYILTSVPDSWSTSFSDGVHHSLHTCYLLKSSSLPIIHHAPFHRCTLLFPIQSSFFPVNLPATLISVSSIPAECSHVIQYGPFKCTVFNKISGLNESFLGKSSVEIASKIKWLANVRI